MTVAYVRSKGGYECTTISEAFNLLMEFSYAQEKLPAGEPLCLGLAWDDPHILGAENCRYEVAVVVHPEVQPVGGMGVRRLEGGLFARYPHFGPYSGLSVAYDRLYWGWLVDSPYLMRSEPTREYYRNDPFNTPPEELLTEIHLPIKRL